MNNILLKTFDTGLSRSVDRDLYNLSTRTIKANEEVKKDLELITANTIRVRKMQLLRKSHERNRKNKRYLHQSFMKNVDSHNPSEMLMNTSKKLNRANFLIRTMMDDGRTTMLMRKFKETEIFVMPKCTVYYRLEKQEFKDKAFLSVKYTNEGEVTLYVSRSSQRPNKSNYDMTAKNPSVVFFNNTFLEQSHLYFSFYSSELHILIYSCWMTHHRHSLPQ